MATLTKKLKEPLLYLDQVRQHLGRLPSIDPNTRTLVICGFPNTGKSSFLKSITRADVDVQPYAFTTKSLFVGHFDHQYLRFCAIDTPGILDHPLEEMNTIEMQSITAIAHLRSAILYFMDLSEQCGYPVSAQIQLFKSIRPLFANKVVFLAINKVDITKPEDLDAATQEELQDMVKNGDVAEILQLSCNTQEGVQEAKNAACERLMAERVSQKLKAGTSNTGAIGGRLAEVMTRIHVAQPMGGVAPETFIPEAIKNMKKYDKSDPERRMLAKDIEQQNGGAGVYNVDLKADYLLENPEWKYDKVPEVLDGKNVYDYIDPDIDAKLDELEKEEERLQAEGYYDEDEEETDEEDRKVLEDAGKIREKIALIRNDARMKKRLKNAPIMPRSKTKRNLSEMDEALDVLGVDTSRFVPGLQESLPRRSRGGKSRAASEDAMDMDLDGPANAKARVRAMSKARGAKMNRMEDGVEGETARTRAERLQKLNQKRMNRMARQGEADRHETPSLAKHLVSSGPLSLPPLNCLPALGWKVVANKSTVRRQARYRQDAAPLRERWRGPFTPPWCGSWFFGLGLRVDEFLCSKKVRQ